MDPGFRRGDTFIFDLFRTQRAASLRTNSPRLQRSRPCRPPRIRAPARRQARLEKNPPPAAALFRGFSAGGGQAASVSTLY